MTLDNTARMNADHSDQNFADDDWRNDGDDVPKRLFVNIEIDDPIVIEALRSYPAGLARARFVEQALRIGVMAINSANGQIDTDAVRNEGDRLIEELTRLIDTHQSRTSEELEGVLKEYFNPENGRFTENVGRLVSQDGDLQRLLQNHLDQAQTGIQKTIDQLVGQNSPLMQVLNPGEANAFFKQLNTVANAAVEAQNQAILKQFSLDTPESALNRLLNELRTSNTQVGSNLQNHITGVMQEFSLDHEESALNRMLKQIQDASTQIRGEFTLDNEASALARVRRELKDLIEAQNESTQQFQTRISNELSALFARRQEAQRGVQHGNDFEAAVVSTLQEMLYGNDDEVEAVGSTTGEIAYSKVGDAVITLGPDCIATGARIVVEAKEDESYTLAKSLEEMTKARQNRKAEYGIFVVSSKMSFAKSIPLLRRYDNDVLVVWNAEDRNTDVALMAAITVAKGLIVRAAREREGFAADLNAMDSAIAGIVRQIEQFDEVNTSANTIKTSAEKIMNRTRLMRERMEKELDTLTNEIEGLRNARAR
jgi:gas vesicle protein